MKQLLLTSAQLKSIGFIKKVHPATDELNPEKVTYEIECMNGVFYYTDNEEYRWYQKIVIGDCANFIHLDIQHPPSLYTILAAFRVEYRLVLI